MKGKIILLSLAVSGFLVTTPNAYATTNQEVSKLSSTIADLVNLDAKNQSLIEQAIDRALIVKEIQNTNNPQINGDFPQNLHPRGRFTNPKKPNTTVEKIKDIPTHTVKHESPRIMRTTGLVDKRKKIQ